VGFLAGEEYNGKRVERVQRFEKKGFGVAVLVGGTLVKFSLETGDVLAVKEPSKEESGTAAPPPVSEALPVSSPDWVQQVLEKKNLREVVELALAHMGEDQVKPWALSVHEQVPVLRRLNRDALPARIDRVIVTLKELT
jgi:hypothetical protein